MPLITQLFAVLVFACLSFAARGEKLRIVTEPWAPYVYEENGKNLGLDYETTAIVFKRLGIEVEWQFLPWKRCLSMLETGQADGALDIFHSDERDATLLYPSEPLSDVEFVMFYANDRPHPFTRLDELKGLTIGTSPRLSVQPRLQRIDPVYPRARADPRSQLRQTGARTHRFVDH